MNVENLIINLQKAVEKEKFSTLYVTLQKVFNEIHNLGQYEDWIFDFLTVLEKNFEVVLEKDWQKNRMTRDVLQQSLSQAMGDEKIDVKKDDFFKQKIYALLDTEKDLIFEMFADPQFPRSDTLTSLLVKIVKYYKFKSDEYVSFFFSAFFKEKMDIEEFRDILDAFFDLSPKISIELAFRWMQNNFKQEKLLIGRNLARLSILMELFAVYCEIYPDYFRNYLDEFIEIFISNQENLVRSELVSHKFAFFIHYFAKQGEYIGSRFILDIFNIAENVNKTTQRLLFLTVKETVENYPEEIAQSILIGRPDRFYEQILKLIEKTRTRSILDILIDILFLVKVEIEKIQYENDDSSIPLAPELTCNIFTQITVVIDELIPIINDYSYLLLKSISEIDQVIQLYNEDYQKNDLVSFEKRFLDDDILSQDHNGDEIKSLLINLTRELEREIDKIRSLNDD